MRLAYSPPHPTQLHARKTPPLIRTRSCTARSPSPIFHFPPCAGRPLAARTLHHSHTAPTSPSPAPVIPALATHAAAYATAPVASTPRTVTTASAKVLTPLTTIAVSVRLITT